MHRARRLSGERGAAIVEMILVLPLLLFVMFAIVELSRAWFTLQLATAAIRDGARAAAVAASGNVSSAGTTRITSILAAGGITTSSQGATLLSGFPTVNLFKLAQPPNQPCPLPLPVTVDCEVVAKVTVRFSTFFPLLPPSLQSMDLVQTARMRWEGG